MEECKNQILIKLHQLLEFLKPDIYFEVSERERERERERASLLGGLNFALASSFVYLQLKYRM